MRIFLTPSFVNVNIFERLSSSSKKSEVLHTFIIILNPTTNCLIITLRLISKRKKWLIDFNLSYSSYLVCALMIKMQLSQNKTKIGWAVSIKNMTQLRRLHLSLKSSCKHLKVTPPLHVLVFTIAYRIFKQVQEQKNSFIWRLYWNKVIYEMHKFLYLNLYINCT